MLKARKEFISNIIKITVGAIIFAISVEIFALPNDLGEGGVTGITIILNHLYEIPTAYTNMFFNSILLVIGYKFLDKKTIFYTLYAIAIMSIFLKVFQPFPVVTAEPLVAALAAGVFMGLGIGLIMRGEGTTAGSSILAKLANKYLGWNVSYALLFFDLIVVIPSIFVIGFESMVFTFVSLAISTKLLDFILEGSNPKKSISIISEKHEEIASAISAKLERGITVVDAEGYYKKNPKKLLYVVISRQQLLPIQKIINEIDPLAFVIINDVQSVIGEGFTRELFVEDEPNPNEL